MTARVLAGIREISAGSWNALFPPQYPFGRHDFLDALETHGCVGGRTGWEPCHLVLEHGADVVAAMPLYRKRHSYGEFVFDFGWARAAQQLGLRYYPKLLCAIPFTPVSGPRLGARTDAHRRELAAAALRLQADGGLSSFHGLFFGDEDRDAFTALGALERHDLQYHWHGRGDADFASFLARLRHDKRKKILRERRRVREAGIRFEWRRGEELTEAEWAEVYALYGNTYEERGQAPYLTPGFFLDYGRRPGNPLQLIMAYDGARLTAVAITLVGGATLYGRHWGCAERYDGLHFETCYYQGIELCLARGLSHFDAGAQGEHKLARGFEPVVTRSVHALADARLARAVGRALEEERQEVERQRAWLTTHGPYRSDADG